MARSTQIRTSRRLENLVSRRLEIIIIVLATIGLAVSILGTWQHYSTLAICPIGSGCDLVNRGPYSTIGLVPIAVIGIFGYVLIGLLALRKQWQFLKIIVSIGFAFSLYLIGLEIFKIGAFCWLCAVSQIAITLIFLLSFTILRPSESGLDNET